MHKTSKTQIMLMISGARLHQVRGPGSAEPTFSTLLVLVHALLALPASNADSEHCFSMVQKLTLKSTVTLFVPLLYHFWPSRLMLTITVMPSNPPMNCWSLINRLWDNTMKQMVATISFIISVAFFFNFVFVCTNIGIQLFPLEFHAQQYKVL